MSTTVRPARAWIPATVTTLLVVLLLFGCGLLREILDDQDISRLRDPDNVLGAYIYGPMAPLGGPGIVGPRPFGDSMAQLGGGLVPVVILVFLFTWLSARAGSSAFSVLSGAWLGTILGVGMGSLASYQIFLWQNDFPDDPYGPLQKLDQVELGLYWGAVAGLFAGLVALLVWMVARPRAGEPTPDAAPETTPEPGPAPGPPDPTAYPPPGEHARPAGPATPEETMPAPDPRHDHPR